METFLLPVSGALTAGVDGFDLKGELQVGHSSLRFWPEESVQFQNDEMKGTLGSSGQRSRSSLRCWHENTEQFHGGVSGRRSRSSIRRWQENTLPFHEPATKGEMFWSRRRRRRGGCLAETRSTFLICPLFALNLHCHVFSASPLPCMVISIHTACMMLVVFGIRRIRGETQKLGDNASVHKGEQSR